MHELAITRGIVDTVTRHVPDAKVTCVRLEIGELSGVVADSVRFCFDLVTEGTALAGACLEITQAPARCRCRDCGEDFSPQWPIMACVCGSADVEVRSGEDLRILAVEVA